MKFDNLPITFQVVISIVITVAAYIAARFLIGGLQAYLQYSELLYQVVSLVLATVVALVVASWIARCLRTKISVVRALMANMSNGTLSGRSQCQGHNEFSQLCMALDKTLDKFDSSLKVFKNIGIEVESSVQELTLTMSQLEEVTLNQHQQIERVTSTISDLSAVSLQVTSQANEAEKYALQGMEIAQQSLFSTEERACLSRSLEDELNQAVDKAEALKRSSTRITEFVHLIEDVSERTNLLALNAAIEASRAGVSGRGFAVVADEVRVLAQQTSSNTLSIQKLIGALQKDSQDMVNSMEVCLGKVTENADLAKKSAQDTHVLLDGIREIIIKSKGIAIVSSEQSQVISSINEKIRKADECMIQSEKGVEQGAKIATLLLTLSARQRDKLAFFKTS